MASLIPLIIAILTAIPALVQAAEALHDQSGAGPAKKTFVLDAVRKLVTVAQAADPKVSKFLTPQVTQQIEEVSGASVDAAVAVMNAVPKAQP